LAEVIKAAYDIFHVLSSAYFYKFSKIAYENSLSHIQKQFSFILSYAIKIAYTNLYINAYDAANYAVYPNRSFVF
jgi:hypothetical protein